MPGRTLPNFLVKEIASHNSPKSCYVTIGTKVYDVTDFLESHPGGADLILEHGGKDVKAIMEDEISHRHTEGAYDILEDDYLVGFVATEPVLNTAIGSDHPHDILPLPPNKAGMQELQDNGAVTRELSEPASPTTGMSSAEDLYKETDAQEDLRKHKFLDLDKPLLMQVWNGRFSKDVYLNQVHRPRQYKGGASAPLFGNFLEPLSKTAWYVIPTVWLPPVAYGTWLAYQGLPSAFQTAAYWLTGLALWTLVEYGLHRGLFHVDKYNLCKSEPFISVLILCQISTRQPCWNHCPFLATWHPPLPPYGQIPAGNAACPLCGACNPILQARPYCILLGLVCSHGGLLWRYFRVYLL